MFPQYALSAAFGVVAVVIGISPLAIAAQGSVPGDLLYPVKVIVNEPVQNVVSKITNKDRKQEEGPGKKTLNQTRDAQLTEGVQKMLQSQASDPKPGHNDDTEIKKQEIKLPDAERTN